MSKNETFSWVVQIFGIVMAVPTALLLSVNFIFSFLIPFLTNGGYAVSRFTGETMSGIPISQGAYVLLFLGILIAYGGYKLRK